MVDPLRGRPRGLGAITIIVVAALLSACASANEAPNRHQARTGIPTRVSFAPRLFPWFGLRIVV